jgi:rod shape-determining protein MreC
VLSSFALLTATYGQSSGGLQRGVSAVFGPLQEGADRALKPARDLVNWFDETFDARGENDRLKSELEDARSKAIAGEVAVQERDQLQKLLGLDHSGAIPSGYDPVTARVVARSPTIWYSSVTVDKGTSSGVKVNDPVVNGDGLVGRVGSATSGSAQVILITDPSSAVSGKIVPGGVQGIIKPEVGNAQDLILDFLDSSKTVHQGQDVVTAGWRAEGLASLFPPNIPVGRVTEASLVEQEASQQVHLRPFADMRSLDLLQVLTGGSRN